jgi:hypothetical protein
MGVLKVSDNSIFIDFLDEQLGERKVVSQKARERALKRWNHDANAMPTHSPRNAEEKRKEESEIREYGPQTETFVIVLSKYLNQAKAKIYSKAGLIEYMEDNQTILNNSQLADKFMLINKGKVFNDLGHLQNSYALFVKDQFK